MAWNKNKLPVCIASNIMTSRDITSCTTQEVMSHFQLIQNKNEKTLIVEAEKKLKCSWMLINILTDVNEADYNTAAGCKPEIRKTFTINFI